MYVYLLSQPQDYEGTGIKVILQFKGVRHILYCLLFYLVIFFQLFFPFLSFPLPLAGKLRTARGWYPGVFLAANLYFK